MVLGGFLIATAGSKLLYSLETNVQRFQLLSNDALGLTPSQVLHQESQTELLWERESVENHALFSTRGTQ